MASSYTPVSYDYREVIEEEIKKKTSGKIFYFGDQVEILEAQGCVLRMTEKPGLGIFIELDSDGDDIRIDRIITLFGKPGAAYDEYDAYANACLACNYGEGFGRF
jgi:hypothetical protein